MFFLPGCDDLCLDDLSQMVVHGNFHTEAVCGFGHFPHLTDVGIKVSCADICPYIFSAKGGGPADCQFWIAVIAGGKGYTLFL